MKKNANTSDRKKLALRLETLRMLTDRDLELVVGGAGATNTSGASKQTAREIPTC